MTAYDPTLPAGSTLGKSYEYGVDLDTGTTGSTFWQAVRRAFNINPQMTPVTQDAQTYDDKGSPNADVAAWAFVVNLSVYVNRANGVLPAELRALQMRYGDAIAEDAVIGLRWYHKPSDGSTPDPNESFEGKATVAITRANIDPTGANERWDVVITGNGPAVRIDNPFNGWADATTVPVITSVSPAGQAVGEQVVINGSAFVGGTGVTIDGLPAEHTTLSSSTVVAVIPDTAAGAADVIVTTGAGASAPFSYTVV